VGEQSVLDQLREEHESILRQVDVVRQRLAQLSGKPEADSASAVAECQKAVLRLRRAFLVHRCREEVGLFPEVELLISEGTARVDIVRDFLYGEAEDDILAHLEIEQNLTKMGELIEGPRRRDTTGAETLGAISALSQATLALLERHAQKEDSLVFPMMVRMLSEEQLGAVGRRLDELCLDVRELPG
jgi:hemerythrin-like domain-containing protein